MENVKNIIIVLKDNSIHKLVKTKSTSCMTCSIHNEDGNSICTQLGAPCVANDDFVEFKRIDGFKVGNV